jgi:hypothetical protein
MGGGTMMDRENIAHGTPEAYREFIYDMLFGVYIHAEVAASFATAGDDTGLEFALRRLVAHTRAACKTFKDLKVMKEAGHAQ